MQIYNPHTCRCILINHNLHTNNTFHILNI
ncbi:hypothetical protein FDC50_14485 [Clostridium botulinum]|nr:hypothetical protein [Clostridium botulinum]NFL07950.1 hypothetical protein [Clostridium botulinum]NFP08802.1 hypothetical protein [Clostridium botulinum]NFP13615.1 hypothetical protein [Clostridium botulinum]